MFQNKSIGRSCWSPVTSRHLNSFGEITRILLNWLNSGPTDMCCVMILGPTGGSSVGSASGPTCCYRFEIILLGQWLNFKLLFRITYLVGKLKLISVISGFPLGWVIQSNQKKMTVKTTPPISWIVFRWFFLLKFLSKHRKSNGKANPRFVIRISSQ